MPIRIIGMTEKQSYNQVQLRKHFDVASDICSEILQFMEKTTLHDTKILTDFQRKLHLQNWRTSIEYTIKKFSFSTMINWCSMTSW